MPQDRNEPTFGELLGIFYMRSGLSQEDLAQRIGVSSAAFRSWLRAKNKGRSGITGQNLLQVIKVLSQAGVFRPGEEEAEARKLWRSATELPFDEGWWQGLARRPDATKLPQKGQQRTRAELGRIDSTPSSTPSIFFFNTTRGLPDPREFYGREQERARLLEQTYKQQSTSIVGPNKIGKTWLMDYLRLTALQRLGKRFRVGYINALSPSCATVEGFTTLAAQQFGISPAAQYVQHGLTPLEQIVANLLDENYVPVLCIDGFDAFAMREAFDRHFFGNLRALAMTGLCLVTTSKRQLVDIVVGGSRLSSLINIFDPIILGSFTEREAMDFVTKKGGQAGLSEEERSYLLRYGQVGDAWPPGRLQLVGEMLVWDKQWGNYRPSDAEYWQKFVERLEERYQGVLPQ